MKICIIGVGNIGMRYVQGITKKIPAAELILIDCDKRLKELENLELGPVKYFTSVGEFDEPIDLFVISTSCESRLSIYKQCLELNPKFTILEKYLFKSREEFDECLALKGVPTFVNQWMYGSRAFDRLFSKDAKSVEVLGSGWGLSCNAVHWMDVLKRHLNITHLKVGSGTTVTEVFPSKRAGYEELRGEWIFEDADSDKSFKLIDRSDDSPADGLRIKVDEAEYFFDYTAIKIGEKIVSHFPYFSDQIGDIVLEIFEKGSCSLPLLEESISQHLLVEDILETLEHRPIIT